MSGSMMGSYLDTKSARLVIFLSNTVMPRATESKHLAKLYFTDNYTALY